MATIQELLSRKPIEEIFDIAATASASDAAQAMVESRIGVLIVRDPDGPMVGIISERDIVRAVATRPSEANDLKVSDLLTENVETCRYKDGLIDVARRMRKGQFRHMPVTDEKGLVGVVSMTDIFRYYIDYEPTQQTNLMAAYYMT